MLCHQRKVKCDRRTPCANCIKSGSECVPAAVTRRRPRRRIVEQELLERVRRYEELLRTNSVGFEPLHNDTATGKTSPNTEGDYGSDYDKVMDSIETESGTPSSVSKPEKSVHYEAKYVSSDEVLRF